MRILMKDKDRSYCKEQFYKVKSNKNVISFTIICVGMILILSISSIIAYYVDKDSIINNLTIADCYTVIFDSNDGTETTVNQDIFYNGMTNLIPNTFARGGYTFIGWNTQPDGTGTSYEDKQAVTDLGDITLYAKWKKETEYNVSKGAKLLDSGQLKSKINTLGTNFSSITAFKKSSSAPDPSVSKVEIQANNSAYKIYGWWNGTVFYWYCAEDSSPLLNSYMRDLFSGCSNLVDISGLADFDSSSVTNIQGMFQNARQVNSLECLSRWNTSSLVLLQSTFQGTSITSLNGLENWNVGNVTIMQSAFTSCSNLTDITAVKNWDTSKVTNMSGLFQNCKLSSITCLQNWNTSNVTEMIQIFENNSNLTSIEGIENWNVSKVRDLRQAFYKCQNVESLEPLRNWSTQSLTSLKLTFSQMKKITSVEPLKNWDVSKVTIFESTFDSDSLITSLTGLEDWDVSSATNMSVMCYGLSSLTDATAITDWNVTSSINFTKMFKNCNRVTLPIFTNLPGTWDSNGTYIPTT